MNDRSYLLKISLMYIEPQIWRRFVVPASLTLSDLHHVVQIVMGWDNDHLYEFVIRGQHYSEDPEGGVCGLLESSEYSLGDLIKRKGASFHYRYDFGDSWEHSLKLEDSRYVGSDLNQQIVCLAGERACPPEDVGGVRGYQRLCAAFKNRSSAEYEELREWFDGDFDAEFFDVKAVNRRLQYCG